MSKNKTMTISELMAEYEVIMDIVLTERDKIIFRYAYMVGKRKWNKKDYDTK